MSATSSPADAGGFRQRAGGAALMSVVAAGLVQAILANPEAAISAPATPDLSTGHRPGQASLAPRVARPPAAPKGHTAPQTPENPGAAQPHPASPAPAVPVAPAPSNPAGAGGATGPVPAAIGWYATRHHLPATQVKALQADQVSGGRTRVLLLVSKPGRRLDSAIVTVARTPGGKWEVTGP